MVVRVAAENYREGARVSLQYNVLEEDENEDEDEDEDEDEVAGGVKVPGENRG